MFVSVCVCVRLCVCLRGSTETSRVAHCLIFTQLSRFETFGRNMTGYRYFEKVKETLSTGLATSHRDPQYNFSCSWIGRRSTCSNYCLSFSLTRAKRVVGWNLGCVRHLLSSNFGHCAWLDGRSKGKGFPFWPFRQGEAEWSGKGTISRGLAKRPPLHEL